LMVLLGSCVTGPPSIEKGSEILAATAWVTTAVYRQVDGKLDEGTNYINDPVAQGTVSSARYSSDRFVFVPVDIETGEFDLGDVSALVRNSGKYELIADEAGNLSRRVYDTTFGYTHTRTITHLSAKEFTYTFENDGQTYYVEHRPYFKVYPGVPYPEELETAVQKSLRGE